MILRYCCIMGVCLERSVWAADMKCVRFALLWVWGEARNCKKIPGTMK